MKKFKLYYLIAAAYLSTFIFPLFFLLRQGPFGADLRLQNNIGTVLYIVSAIVLLGSVFLLLNPQKPKAKIIFGIASAVFLGAVATSSVFIFIADISFDWLERLFRYSYASSIFAAIVMIISIAMSLINLILLIKRYNKIQSE